MKTEHTNVWLRALRLLGLAGFALAAVAAPALAGTWHATGQVTYADGAPAAGVEVILRTPTGRDVSTITDRSGHYELKVQDASGSVLVWAVEGPCSSPVSSFFEEDITKNLRLNGPYGGC